MITLQLLVVYSLSFATACAVAYAARTMSTNSTSQSTSQIQSIQQCIWDHGIFCIMLDFLHYQDPSLHDSPSQVKHLKDSAINSGSSVGDCTFTSTHGVDKVSPCADSAITPSTASLLDPTYDHSVTSTHCPLPNPPVRLYELESRLELMKRPFEIGIQFGLVLVSMMFMIAALHGLLKLCLTLWQNFSGSNEAQCQQGSRLQQPSPSAKVDRQEEIRQHLQWLERREVNPTQGRIRKCSKPL